MAGDSVIITKASGEKVIFEPEKLLRSLKSAGASDEISDQILEQILSGLEYGASTGKIYQEAFRLLKKLSRPSAPKYKLKRAVMELGPSGYPFEKYVGEILKKRGYQTEVGIIMDGKCVTHEVDVLARKEGEQMAIECKFGNHNGKKVDIKVALYVNSRFQDLKRQWRKENGNKRIKFRGGIFTNGNFTSDATKYGTCVGLDMVSWSFPRSGNLNQMIIRSRLFPVTSLTFVTKKEKEYLLKEGIVLVNELAQQREALDHLRLPRNRIRKALEEIEALCN
jgi:hypothetical protein